MRGAASRARSGIRRFDDDLRPASTFLRRTLLGRIAAVREGRCTILDGKSYLNRPGSRLAASAELLAAALRPSAHADLAATYAPATVTGWSPL